MSQRLEHPEGGQAKAVAVNEQEGIGESVNTSRNSNSDIDSKDNQPF